MYTDQIMNKINTNTLNMKKTDQKKLGQHSTNQSTGKYSKYHIYWIL